ncbi:MAG: hypothetical protein ACLFTG_11705 [Alphaproteobacteria bacterium]
MTGRASPSDRWASREKAIDLAQDSSKQLITICTAILSAILAALVLDRGDDLSAIAWLLSGAAVSCLLSILGGIFALYALAGILETGLHLDDGRPLMTRHYRGFAFGQFVFFVLTCLLILLSILRVAWLGSAPPSAG